MLPFFSVVWKLILGVRTQEDLKRVCGLKLFYLLEDDKVFFTQWYTNNKCNCLWA